MLLHPTQESWLRRTSDIKNETGCQSFIEFSDNEKLHLKQQLVLGHSASKGRRQAVCKPWSPQKQARRAESQELHAKCAILEVFYKELQLWIHGNQRLLFQRVTGLMEVGQLLCTSGGGLLNWTKTTK